MPKQEFDIEATMDLLRKQSEACNAPTAIQILSHLAESIDLTRLCERVYDTFCQLEKLYITSTPKSYNDWNTGNTIQNAHVIYELSDAVLLTSQRKLFEICEDTPNGIRNDCQLVGACMADLTSMFRFPNPKGMRQNWRKVLMSLMPFPRLKFLGIGSTLASSEIQSPLSVEECTSCIMRNETTFSDATAKIQLANKLNASAGLALVNYRGSFKDIEKIPDAIKALQQTLAPPEDAFSDSNIIPNTCHVPNIYTRGSVSYIFNSQESVSPITMLRDAYEGYSDRRESEVTQQMKDARYVLQDFPGMYYGFQRNMDNGNE
eukprot:CAMPEP_0168519240 /NCGR_PEP_ID=MMETSP0405-20121227/7197_1 /TAXON_ID=498012 /ORGANISM="Trichosphaerium sp, Strain Am-I-7 wt" /LENGTH=318 /DNA_ID=CAMNT_0008539739 /DNA_START=405 /DNA_END=1361 /DNA_ORIENTATION=+